jgi:hypothetical protein
VRWESLADLFADEPPDTDGGAELRHLLGDDRWAAARRTVQRSLHLAPPHPHHPARPPLRRGRRAGYQRIASGTGGGQELWLSGRADAIRSALARLDHTVAMCAAERDAPGPA